MRNKPLLLQRIVNYTLSIVALLSALNILFHISQIWDFLFGYYGGGAGYEEYVVGSIVALILFVVYLILHLINKSICQSKCLRYIHILCLTNIILYMIVWIYVIAFAFQW